ncbi:PspC domain-containing protein [Natronosporangium hydrolyticum]|uniref:PspC domain-containing protein n=1 Tax=Natronosporangium hydrolyticum TaxID=2811111 RepID=A0A895YJT3_9ACTN|nr:PspC domain-containing protein [Natronosporangium hydrolyticum]QSB15603.1 PspC domain-containing protein [Natronosporangium hydrolyticum]
MADFHETPQHSPTPYRRLQRSRNNRMIAGVCAGLADYLRIDPTVVRVGVVVLAFLTWGVVLLGYLVAWLLMPEADSL